jgi:hypothetical protein
MKLKFDDNSLIVTRTKEDQTFKNESHFLHWVKRKLQDLGYDVIKKLMWKDGHLVSDTQHYIRSRNMRRNWVMIYSDHYAIADLGEEFNEKGEVRLAVEKSK